jgi:hypothetical protein
MTALLALAAAAPAAAETIYFTDANGKVGRYDTVTTAQSVVGNLSASFSIGQVVGLAYDGGTNSLYVLDRGNQNVYRMDASSGAASLAFATTGTFQGGAYKNGLLYGVSENDQTLDGYNATTGANLGIGGTNIDHTHALGVNAATGQLYIGRNNAGVYAISDDGNTTSLVATYNGIFEDLDYFGGDFLFVDFDSDVTVLGTNTTLFTASGFGSLSGVAVAAVAGPRVPEPATWAMMISGFGLLGAAARRRTRTGVTFA